MMSRKQKEHASRGVGVAGGLVLSDWLADQVRGVAPGPSILTNGLTKLFVGAGSIYAADEISGAYPTHIAEGVGHGAIGSLAIDIVNELIGMWPRESAPQNVKSQRVKPRTASPQANGAARRRQEREARGMKASRTSQPVSATHSQQVAKRTGQTSPINQVQVD